jgi:hypothetical protein
MHSRGRGIVPEQFPALALDSRSRIHPKDTPRRSLEFVPKTEVLEQPHVTNVGQSTKTVKLTGGHDQGNTGSSFDKFLSRNLVPGTAFQIGPNLVCFSHER